MARLPRAPNAALVPPEQQDVGSLPPPPPPAALPEEYEIFDLAACGQAIEFRSPSRCCRAQYRVYPPTRPSTRSDVQQLAVVLEQMLDEAGTSTSLALKAWDCTFAELVRQVFVQCSDRGELLGRVRRAYGHYLSELMRRLRALQGTRREHELRQLQEENKRLLEELGYDQSELQVRIALLAFQR